MYTFAVYWAGSYFAEQDNSWHQVSIRDTPFTANHIIEFYFNFPFYVLLGGSAWLYARTRLPLYAKGISLPLTLAVIGPFMIFVSVGFNEWGHTFWFREEFFAAPIHWGFVHWRLVRPRRRRYLAATSDPGRFNCLTKLKTRLEDHTFVEEHRAAKPAKGTAVILFDAGRPSGSQH